MHFEKEMEEKKKKHLILASTMCQELWQEIYTYNPQQQIWDYYLILQIRKWFLWYLQYHDWYHTISGREYAWF